jgi:DNA-binding response OmpR family regulator
MEPEHILVVDDDPDLLRILRDNLELDGYRVSTATTGKQALSVFNEGGIGLIILDLTLPDIDGIRICRSVREKSDVPVIMLTARAGVPDKVLGLETGGDDYMVKPFDYLELAARVRARLRRRAPIVEPSQVLQFGGLRIDTGAKTVFKNDKEITLTLREFTLLLLLAGNVGRAMSRTTIRHALWPEGELYRGSRAIDVHIQHLRSKLEDNPQNPKYIETVQGVGYMFSYPKTRSPALL